MTSDLRTKFPRGIRVRPNYEGRQRGFHVTGVVTGGFNGLIWIRDDRTGEERSHGAHWWEWDDRAQVAPPLADGPAPEEHW